MNPDASILSISGAALRINERSIPLPDLVLRAGSVACIVAPGEDSIPVLGDSVCGLAEPTRGIIALEGRDWRSIPHQEACRLRSEKIGRVLSKTAWVSNLDLDENLTLSARHHTTLPVMELKNRATAHFRGWAGAPELPEGRPAWLPERMLQLAQWTRALAHRPVLLVLERPLKKVGDADAAALFAALDEARARGAAILWLDTRTEGPATHWPDAPCFKLSEEITPPVARSTPS